MSTYGVYADDLIGLVWGVTFERAERRARRMWPDRSVRLLSFDEAYGDRMLRDGVDCIELIGRRPERRRARRTRT